MERRRRRQTTAMQGSRRLSEYREDEIPAELYETSTSRFSDASLFQRAPDGSIRTHFPWRTAIISLAMFLLGVSFLLTAFLHFKDYDNETFIAFLVVGGISFLPSCYAIFNIIQWYRGVPGFHLSDWAHWDDYRT